MKNKKKSSGIKKTGTVNLPSNLYQTFIDNLKALKHDISEDKKLIHYWVVEQNVDVTRYDSSVYQHKIVRQLMDRLRSNKEKLENLENIMKCSKEKKKGS